jgi:hypothetical protein
MPRNTAKPPLRHAARQIPAKRSFRDRYEDLEKSRSDMIERLNRLGERGRTHPSFKRAAVLLNETFRKASIAQRLAVLQAAQWVIELMENSIGLI